MLAGGIHVSASKYDLYTDVVWSESTVLQQFGRSQSKKKAATNKSYNFVNYIYLSLQIFVVT